MHGETSRIHDPIKMLLSSGDSAAVYTVCAVGTVNEASLMGAMLCFFTCECHNTYSQETKHALLRHHPRHAAKHAIVATVAVQLPQGHDGAKRR